MALQCVLVLLTVLCIAAQAPGTDFINSEDYPFNPGFSDAFGISRRAATAFALPGTFLTAFGFLFSFGRVVHSAAQSKLLPRFLTHSLADGQKPYTALITGSIIAFLLEFVFLYMDASYRNAYIAFLAACRCIIFVSLLVGFIYFRRSFGHLPRGFRSPLGVYGAVYGIVIFAFGVLAVVVIMVETSSNLLLSALPVLVGYLLLTGVPYFAYVRYHQYYSQEEQTILFSVYVVQGKDIHFLLCCKQTFPAAVLCLCLHFLLNTVYQLITPAQCRRRARRLRFTAARAAPAATR